MTTQWRNQQKEKLFELLYHSALNLFEGQGFDETSVQQICDKARVAKGTFFNYFPSKDHVLGEWYVRSTLIALEAVETNKFASAKAALLALSDRLVSNMIDHPALWGMKAGRVLATETLVESERSLDQRLIGFSLKYIKKGVEQGELAPDLDQKLFADMFVTVLTGTGHTWVVVGQSFDLKAEIRKRIAFLFKAGGI